MLTDRWDPRVVLGIDIGCDADADGSVDGWAYWRGRVALMYVGWEEVAPVCIV